MKVTASNVGWVTPTSNPWHIHEFWELMVIPEGHGTLFIGDSAVKLEPGSIILQPPGFGHRVQAEERILVIWFRLDDFTPPCKDEIPTFRDEESRFCLLSQMLHEALFRERPNQHNYIAALLNTMYQMMVCWSQSAGVDSLSEGLIREMIQNIPNPDYDILDYIRRSGYCADHFRRCFKKATGQTPNAYLIQLRIENARRLLNQCAHGNFGFTIKEIAAESGFQDSHYFSSMFKKVTGLTPSAYQSRSMELGSIDIDTDPFLPSGDVG